MSYSFRKVYMHINNNDDNLTLKKMLWNNGYISKMYIYNPFIHKWDENYQYTPTPKAFYTKIFGFDIGSRKPQHLSCTFIHTYIIQLYYLYRYRYTNCTYMKTVFNLSSYIRQSPDNFQFLSLTFNFSTTLIKRNWICLDRVYPYRPFAMKAVAVKKSLAFDQADYATR